MCSANGPVSVFIAQLDGVFAKSVHNTPFITREIIWSEGMDDKVNISDWVQIIHNDLQLISNDTNYINKNNDVD